MDGDCSTGTGLLLGLGRSERNPLRSLVPEVDVKKKLVLKFDDILPCLTLGLSGPTPAGFSVAEIIVGKTTAAEELLQQGSSASPVSSFSNSSGSKRDRSDGWIGGGEEREAEAAEIYLERVSSKVGDQEDEDGSPRKKLRLTKEQSAILEDSFKEHSSLTPVNVSVFFFNSLFLIIFLLFDTNYLSKNNRNKSWIWLGN